MGKKKLTPTEEKLKGNELFKLGDFNGAVDRYTRAIEKSAPTETRHGEDGQARSVYHLNRAQAWLKLEKWVEAEADCTTAIALCEGAGAGKKASSKAYWRRAMARKQLGTAGREDGAEGERAWRIKCRAAIDDYRKWHHLATEERTADQQSVRLMQDECEALEKRLKQDTSSATPSTPSRAPGVSPSPAQAPTRAPSTSNARLAAIHESHASLRDLWANEKGKIITAWAECAIKDVRVAKVKEAFRGIEGFKVGGREEGREFPELRPDTLATHSNLLDLISSRALRAPPAFAFHLDHVRAQTVLKSRQPPPPPRLYGYGVPRPAPAPQAPLSGYMQILERSSGDSATFGEVVTFNAGNSQKQHDAKKKIAHGEACTLAEGELMLQRQAVLYTGALNAARVLLQMNPDGEVDEEAVEEYEARVKGRDYAGREEYRLERVEETVRGFLGYAEDHLEFLRTDSEYVVDYVLDRISPSVKPNTPVQRLLVKEEALQLFLNAYARQTLWKECLLIISDLKSNFPASLGTSPSVPLPPQYTRKIGLLAKLVDAFVDLAFRELSQSVEHSFEKEFAKMGRESADDEFFAFLDMIAEFQAPGLAPRRPTANRSQVDPLARMFRALTQIDPQRNPEKTWEVVACLNELKALFEARPEQKSRLSRRLVEGLGEYAEAIELREMLLDSHLPRYNKDWADKSTFLANVQPLWISLERCWVKSVTNEMAGEFLQKKTDAALQAMWSAFDRQTSKDCKNLPGTLFDDLLSTDPNKPANSFLNQKKEEEEDEEDDGPPPLVEISSDEEEASDPDEPPPLASLSDLEDSEDSMPDLDYGSDSDYDDAREEYAAALRDTLAAARGARQAAAPPPRPRLNRHRLRAQRTPRQQREPVREPEAGPSSGTAPSARRAARPIDPDAVPDHHEMEIRQRERAAAAAAGEAEHEPRVKKEKVKTRKGPSREESQTEWETTESSASETETEAKLPEGFVFKVARKYYDVWEQMLGGEGVRRSDVAWQDFRQAMEHIGFQAEKGSGSRWKFHPRGELRALGTIVIHEPHPASTMRVFQVHKVEARLQRRYGLHIDRFVIDTSRRDEARSAL
ncbi:hypothetical protein JCM10213_007721 [Rhodosporidiobolus nylandii]